MPRPKRPKRRDLHTTLNPQTYAMLEKLAQGRAFGVVLDELITAATKKQAPTLRLAIVRNEAE